MLDASIHFVIVRRLTFASLPRTFAPPVRKHYSHIGFILELAPYPADGKRSFFIFA
jgi:hypothetical protein